MPVNVCDGGGWMEDWRKSVSEPAGKDATMKWVCVHQSAPQSVSIWSLQGSPPTPPEFTQDMGGLLTGE